jgi:hypothetical protein
MLRSVFAIVALLILSPFAAGSIVYSNTTTHTGTYHEILASGATNGPEHGNKVTLAGTDRVVTNIAFVMRILGPGAANFHYQARLYANNGPGGQPGTMLWESAKLNGGIDGGADLTYGVPVPNIDVPDTCTVTFQLTDRAIFQAPIGIALFTPPTVGSAAAGYWNNLGGGNWQLAGQAEAPFGVRLTAIPAPSSIATLAIGVLVVGRRVRRAKYSAA